jgi:predicted alpha/beta hydrolase family esterase
MSQSCNDKIGVMTKVIFLPGNGGGTPRDNWFPYLKENLTKLRVEVIDKDFPDNDICRAKFWLPFIKELGADENTILIGHSTGAIASMRFAESNKILGSVLVGGYYTDQGMDSEKQSGYFDTPWNWKAIKNNQQFIIQYNSTNDPFIPIEEAHFVHEKLQTEYYEFTNQGHFGGDHYKKTFPELLEALKKKL